MDGVVAEQAGKIAKLTGAKLEDVPALLKGYVFPTLAEQASDKFLGGDDGQGGRRDLGVPQGAGQDRRRAARLQQIRDGQIRHRGARLELSADLPSALSPPRLFSDRPGRAHSSKDQPMPTLALSTMSRPL